MVSTQQRRVTAGQHPYVLQDTPGLPPAPNTRRSGWAAPGHSFHTLEG